jgi:hypothetical protein
MTETKRDLNADLAICDADTSGPWRVDAGQRPFAELLVVDNDNRVMAEAGVFDDANFIAEARTGWPAAIKRAIAAEAEVLALNTHAIDHLVNGLRKENRRLKAEVAEWKDAYTSAVGIVESRNADIDEMEADVTRLEAEVKRQEKRYHSYVAAVIPVVRRRDELEARQEMTLQRALDAEREVARLRIALERVVYYLERDAHIPAEDAAREALTHGEG